MNPYYYSMMRINPYYKELLRNNSMASYYNSLLSGELDNQDITRNETPYEEIE